MSKYFRKDTGEEVLLGKPFSMKMEDSECSANFSVSNLTEGMAIFLLNSGILTNEPPKANTIPEDFDYYVLKLAKKLKISPDDMTTILNILCSYTPVTAFSMLLKQIALEMDTKYGGHIKDSKELFAVDLASGNVVSVPQLRGTDCKNISLFRTPEDAAKAIKILWCIYKPMYK